MNENRSNPRSLPEVEFAGRFTDPFGTERLYSVWVPHGKMSYAEPPTLTFLAMSTDAPPSMWALAPYIEYGRLYLLESATVFAKPISPKGVIRPAGTSK